jgi:ubiquinone/menaquinone biosynthesis C-methylase UbiE
MFNKESGGALRWFEGKQLLADIRGGDYAHVGEEEAIEKVFSRLSKNKNRSILDVGSGLGGTASFIQKHGWGLVTGIDVEKESIQYSQSKYPEVKFYTCDACSENELKTVFYEQTFDVIVLFHSLCVFPKQSSAIKALRKVAHNKTKLIIFEYEDLTLHGNPLNKTTDPKTYFNVLNRDQFKNILNEAGWSIDNSNIINVSSDFKRWYENFLNKLDNKKDAIISKYGQEYYEKAKKRYGGMVEAIDGGALGGCVIYASS